MKRIFRKPLFSDYYEGEAIPPRTKGKELPEALQQMRSTTAAGTSGDRSGWEYYDADARSFVQQARMVADYEDDTVYRQPCVHYFPTYESLNDRELRGYFGWRTRFRKGSRENAPATFVFLYIFEILNQVGIRDPLEGLQILRCLNHVYGGRDEVIRVKLDIWIPDYLIYYHIPRPEWTERETAFFNKDASLLSEMERCSAGRLPPEAVPKLLDRLLGGAVSKSRMYKADPQWFGHFLYESMELFFAYFAKHRKFTFWDTYARGEQTTWKTFFLSAVFLQPSHHPDETIQIGPYWKLSWDNDFTFETRMELSDKKLRGLRQLFRMMDAFYRERVRFPYPLKKGDEKKWIGRILDKAFANTLLAQERYKKTHISIDTSVLSSIRQDSDVTREKLMTEEERGGAAAAEGEKAAEETAETSVEAERPVTLPETGPLEHAGSEPAAEKAAADAPVPLREDIPGPASDSRVSEAAAENALPYGLTEDEARFLSCVLSGKDIGWIRSKGLMESLLVDSINDKLYAEFGDTVLEDAEGPEVIPDYAEELKGKFQL